MFIPVTKEPQHYVLQSDREADVKTVWWLIPMTAEESSAYRARWRKADNDFTSGSQVRAKETIKVDREQLQKTIDHVDNAFAENDSITGEQVADVIMQCDFGVVQELLMAAQSMAQLKAGGKN